MDEVPTLECICVFEARNLLNPEEPFHVLVNCPTQYHLFITHLLDFLMSSTTLAIPVTTLKLLMERGFTSPPSHEGSLETTLRVVTATTIRHAISLGLAMTDSPSDRSHLNYLASLLP